MASGLRSSSSLSSAALQAVRTYPPPHTLIANHEKCTKSQSKKRKEPEADPDEPLSQSLENHGIVDFSPEVAKFMSPGKGATSSPTETTLLSLPVIVDQVMNDRTPSPPAEINEIVRNLMNLDAEPWLGAETQHKGASAQ